MNRLSGADGPIGVYVHVPFCERKCAYCDFYSLENHGGIEAFPDLIGREIALYADNADPARVRTLYYGGGTPSVLSVDQLCAMQERFRRAFRWDEGAEITIEVNPGTVDRASLAAYRRIGFNRLSIGVQSFDPAALAFLGRIHSADDARRCLRDARAAGFTNCSIDLIYAVPGQSDANWYATLDEAIALGPEHISAYSLIVEEETPLYTRVREGKVIPHADAREAALYEGTMARLSAGGYEHYEVSNYARPGFRSRHNSAYWNHTTYVGFGPSAHSFLAPSRETAASRWSNVRSLQAWSGMIGRGERPLAQEEQLSSRELQEEGIFLGLRANGLDVARVERLSGLRITPRQQQTLRDLLGGGLAVVEGGVVRLTPAGFLLCDEICARVLVP